MIHVTDMARPTSLALVPPDLLFMSALRDFFAAGEGVALLFSPLGILGLISMPSGIFCISDTSAVVRPPTSMNVMVAGCPFGCSNQRAVYVATQGSLARVV